MQKKRLLFYIEPVTYMDQPFRLVGWLSFFSAIAKRSLGYFDCGLASANHLFSASTEIGAFESIYGINPIGLSIANDFNRVEYSRDLCVGHRFSNVALIEYLKIIANEFRPDVVVSLGENRYLQKIFSSATVMYTEVGPMPREGMKYSMHIDPFGHQVHSAFEHFCYRKEEQTGLAGFKEVWEKTWIARVLRESNTQGVADWLSNVRRGRRVMLVALQPRDWLTYEGIGPNLDPISLLRRTALRAGNDWVVIPQWHASDVVPSDQLADDLSRCQPNIMPPPPLLRIEKSELFLPHIDEVATISSNVAAAAAIIGKRINIFGRSKFLPLSTTEPRPRLDLLAFLTNCYCRPLDEFLTVDGAFAEHILPLIRNPAWLFAEREMNPGKIYDFLAG